MQTQSVDRNYGKEENKAWVWRDLSTWTPCPQAELAACVVRVAAGLLLMPMAHGTGKCAVGRVFPPRQGS